MKPFLESVYDLFGVGLPRIWRLAIPRTGPKAGGGSVAGALPLSAFRLQPHPEKIVDRLLLQTERANSGSKRPRVLRCRLGFSLIEILTAVAVLSILAMIILQLTSATRRSIQLSNRPVDAAAQARLALDRLGMDLTGLVKRQDCDFIAVNVSAGSGKLLQFFSMISSTGLSSANNRKMSLLAYQIAPHADNDNMPCLVRAGMPISWSQSGFFGLKANGLPIRFTDTAIFPTGIQPQSISSYDVLAPGVIQMIVGFKLYPDNNPVTLSDGTTTTVINNARGQIVYIPPVRYLTPLDGSAAIPYIDLTRVSSLIVGVAAIDLESLRLLKSSPSQVIDLANAFPVPPVNSSPLQSWSVIAKDISMMPSALPLPVRQSVRVFQRSYPITPLGSGQP